MVLTDPWPRGRAVLGVGCASISPTHCSILRISCKLGSLPGSCYLLIHRREVRGESDGVSGRGVAIASLREGGKWGVKGLWGGVAIERVEAHFLDGGSSVMGDLFIVM